MTSVSETSPPVCAPNISAHTGAEPFEIDSRSSFIDERSAPSQLNNRDRKSFLPPWDARRLGLCFTAFIFVALSVWSLRAIHFSLLELIDGFRTSGYLGRALPPSFEGWPESLRQLVRTFSMAVAGTALATVLSIPLGFLAARNTTPNRFVRTFARSVIVATRAIPDLVFAVFFVVALSIGELPGVLALGVHSIGMLGKLLADSIEEIDEGSREAAFAAGSSKLQAIANAVTPQITPRFLSAVLFRLDINTRVSVVLGFVGAGGIGMELRANLRNPLRYPIGIGQAILVLGLILIVDRLATIARSALDGYANVRSQDRETLGGTSSVVVRRERTFLPPLLIPFSRSRLVLGLFGACGLLGAVLSCYSVGLNPVSFGRAFWKAGKALVMFFPPDFSTNREGLIEGFGQTFAIGLAATFLGLLIGIPMALLVAPNSTPNRAIGFVARFVQVVIRAVPELVVVLLFISAVGLGPLPGAAALTIATFGFTSKLLGDAIHALPEHASEGVRAVGATRKQEIASAISPQMVPNLVGTGLYAFDVNIRSSAILGIVGAGGIGRILDEANAMLQYETVAAVVLLLFVIVFSIEQFSALLRRALL
jgi:phosphonate transport system permease protein